LHDSPRFFLGFMIASVMDDFILPQLFSPQYVLAPERQHSAQHQSDVFFGDIGVQKTAKGDARHDQLELSAQTKIFFLLYRVGSEPGHVTLAVETVEKVPFQKRFLKSGTETLKST